ncbi:hypothetical protein [Streptomyces sp. NPDC101455]|uniref:hypothetical protein n=1 Tax=Streptomyces sp. NPDC101455 TaxID=3366142 RepID=UPI0038071C58
MGRRFKDMHTAEQQYAARQAPALRGLAHAAEQEAERQQMTADVYGRRGRYSDPAKASRAQDEADRQREWGRGLRATANQAEQALAPQKKRRWSW